VRTLPYPFPALPVGHFFLPSLFFALKLSELLVFPFFFSFFFFVFTVDPYILAAPKLALLTPQTSLVGVFSSFLFFFPRDRFFCFFSFSFRTLIRCLRFFLEASHSPFCCCFLAVVWSFLSWLHLSIVFSKRFSYLHSFQFLPSCGESFFLFSHGCP